ncbi:hypothetical protein AB4039_31895 [Streptomyces sp. M-16]|uniref:hypothetical protein n=1 Tax=Streptomyces sp. M-16 TaxID=3233040 RepID=UPI003F9BF6E1
MNDPSTLAAAPHDDRDGPLLTPAPTPAPTPDRPPAGTSAGTPAAADGAPSVTARDVALPASILGPDTAPEGLPGGPADGSPAAVRPTRPPLAPPPPPERRPVPAAPPAPVTVPARERGALRHVLRWPTAAALLLCGVLHLPQDPAAALPGGDPARWTAPAAALLCLLVGGLLAIRDTAVVWRVTAVAALAVVTLHVVGGLVFFDPLLGALGGAYPWAGVTAVLCPGAGAVLAGLALTYRPAHTGAGGTA